MQVKLIRFQSGSTTVSGNVRLVSKEGATIYRCLTSNGYSNPLCTNNTSVSNGGAICLNIAELTLNGTEISGNFMKANSNGSGASPQTGGGAIYMKNASSSITLNSGSIKNNKTNCFGGAMMIFAGDLKIPENSTVTYNGNSVVDVEGDEETVVETRGAFLATSSSNNIPVYIGGSGTPKNSTSGIFESYDELVECFEE